MKKILLLVPCDNAGNLGMKRYLVDSIRRAGGMPFLWAIGGAAKEEKEAVRFADGLMLGGGGDVDAPFYGENRLSDDRMPDAERDEAELFLTHQALRYQKPILGICRGAQVLATAMGGGIVRTAAGHDGQYHGLVAASKTIPPYFRFPKEYRVNSFHRQAVRLPTQARALLKAPDGFIEAFDLPERPFCVGVQWHPEYRPGDICQERLFRAFVRAGGK